MKNSVLATVFATITLAIGTADPAVAASLVGGYSLHVIYSNCNSSGSGSGSINQDSAGCSDYVQSGSFMASGSGQASYDRLRASARIGLSALDPRVYIGNGSQLGNALGVARYEDELTIFIPGRNGEMVDLVFEAAMGGTLSASGNIDTVYGQADANLLVNVNGAKLTVGRNAKSSGVPNSVDTSPGRVQIQVGTPFGVTAELTAKARLQSTTNNSSIFSGDAIADFSNTAGITSFMLFEPGEDGALIPEWDLASESGQFGFYSAVPLPAAAWLFAAALGLLAPCVKRKVKA